MFDFRYHALSLAAVLLALAVGIVIGVAIGDSNLVSSAKSGIVHDLESEVSAAAHQNNQVRAQLANEEAFTNALYPIAVHGLLAGRPVGLVFLGNGSDQIDGLVREAVSQAGGDVVTVTALREPVDLAGLARDAAGTRFAALQEIPASGTAQLQLLERFGALAGTQLVSGGQAVGHELLSRARSQLLSAFDGQLGKLEGLVVARTEPARMTPEAARAANALEAGLVRGAAAAGVATVGVELSGTEPSQVPWYQGRGISSVDDLDATAGRAALAYALGGARGSYGVKGTANSLLPAVTTLGEHL
ncbi:MAG TPA: copper transporter [Solirubrobacteraceae bacterium]|nr:copper transporter [Solirubrobacteraceae bacterium]